MVRILTVRQAMHARPLELPARLSVTEACRTMRSRRVKEVLVVAQASRDALASEVLGIVTESDAVQILASGRDPSRVTLGDVMSYPVKFIAPQRELDHVLMLMRSLRVHRLVVSEAEEVVGLISLELALEAQNRSLKALRKQNARLEAEAHQDALTGLANRRLLDDALERELAQAERSGRSIGLLMIDIDHFKRVNDSYGHPRGDLVLRQLAARLATRVRRSDLLARFGGEEFAVLATVPSSVELLALAEQLRRIVERAPFAAEPALGPESADGPLLSDQEPLDLTVSVGAAMFGGWAHNARRLIKEADTALYSAKAAGRNCVRLADLDPAVPSLRARTHHRRKSEPADR